VHSRLRPAFRLPMFARMKPVAIFLLLFASSIPLAAQETSLAAALLEIRAAEEEFKRLSALVLHVQETQEMILRRLENLQKRQTDLGDEIEKIREQASRAGANAATREELRKLVESVRELDEKRKADNKLILDTMQELARTPPSAPRTNPADRTAEPAGEFFEETVQRGDTVSAIISMYNAEFEKKGLKPITLDQVRRANPQIDVNNIRVGQVIRIPVPSRR
jgi:Skp family chaperone for outer membrane proteins